MAPIPMKPCREEFIYVGSDSSLDYFLALIKEPKVFPRMVDMRFEHTVGQLKEKISQIKEEIHKKEQRLKTYAKYKTFLHTALIHKMNTENLQAAQNEASFELDNSLFAIEGWVPVNKVQELPPLVKEMNVHVEEIALKPTDVPPTDLQNEGAARLGEDLVHIYDTPSNKDKDPSLWVLCFFSLFFAFIIGDGGYGLIFLAVALFVRYKYTLTSAMSRFTNLVMILGTACLLWGFLTNSFFGIPIGLDSPLRKVSLVNWLAEKKADYLITHKDEEWKEWVKNTPIWKTPLTRKLS